MKKILILRFSSIGDIVLTTPVVRCLRLRYPEVQIHYLCKTSYSSILESNPYINKVYHFKSNFKSILADLKAENYDVLIDLHKNLRTFRLRLALGVKAYSFHKVNWAKWLMVNFKINQLPKQHIVDRYMATVYPLDVSYDGQGLDYFIPNEASFDNKQFGLADGEAFLVFAIGAAHATKRMPLEKIKAICALLPQKIVLLGGPTEKNIGDLLTVDLKPRVINVCGELSLHQSADAIRKAALVITHDTGMMHIAAALRKNIISIWGNTIPEFGMYPFYPREVSLNQSISVHGLKCRPCSKIGFSTCPKGHFRCMNDIEIEEVSQAVAKVLP